MSYKIVKSQLPVLGIGGHNLIVVLDDTGKVIHEIDGLATDPKTGEIKPIGTFGDKLIAYNETGLRGYTYYSADEKQQVVFEGTKDEVEELYKLGLKIRDGINQLDLPYPFLGLGSNSNSVASTILTGMGLSDPNLKGGAVPGEGTLLIPQEQLNTLRNTYFDGEYSPK